MNNVLVFPCSSGLSIEIYHSLKHVKNINLYGLNSNKKSRGYYLYTNYEEFISYDDEKFKDKLKIFIDNNNITSNTGYDINLTAAAGNLVKVGGNQALVIPIGNSSSRPLYPIAQNGSIR